MRKLLGPRFLPAQNPSTCLKAKNAESWFPTQSVGAITIWNKKSHCRVYTYTALLSSLVAKQTPNKQGHIRRVCVDLGGTYRAYILLEESLIRTIKHHSTIIVTHRTCIHRGLYDDLVNKQSKVLRFQHKAKQNWVNMWPIVLFSPLLSVSVDFGT